MMKTKSTSLKQIGVWLISTFCVFGFIKLYTLKTSFYITIESNVNGSFQVFWAEKGQPYSEKRSHTVPIHPKVQRLSLKLADMRHVNQIRIDPVTSPAKLIISELLIDHAWFQTVRFNSTSAFKRIKPLYQIGTISYHSNGMTITTTGNDPQLQIFVESKKSYVMYGVYLIALLCTSILLVGMITGYTDHIWIVLKRHKCNSVFIVMMESFVFLCCVVFFLIYANKQFVHSISFLKQLFP